MSSTPYDQYIDILSYIYVSVFDIVISDLADPVSSRSACHGSVW